MGFEKIKQLFGKNKHMQGIYIILIIGVAILFFTSSFFVRDGTKTAKEDTVRVSSAVGKELQTELEDILSQIAGVGEVSVMITYEGTGEKYYAADVTSESSTNSSDTAGQETSREQESAKQSTKLITPSNEPVLTKENYPKVQGVIVVCDGARDAQVKQDITSAVRAALDVADHKISVFARK